ncbi:hypothetical protein [Nitrosospira sp. Nl5]|uniref:hypothetical protein n=1 Tax=Nitrosospira sp. Nl5 TaxID=200120 RepID=UPI000B8427F0|nr:hypothetical protein [Nitrosospira sp. Nl5]
MIRLLFDKTVGGTRHGEGVMLDLGTVIESQLIASGDAASANLEMLHPYYHFHGFAGDQASDDSVFYDKSGINHAVRGANLSVSQLWTTVPGYASTIDPAPSLADSVLRIPAINFDYSGGEKLIVWMLGKWTPEGSDTGMIGDGYNTLPGQRGWQIRVMASGKLQPVLRGATSGFGGVLISTPFNGTLRDFGVVLDGQAKKYCVWVDGAVDPFFSSAYLTFSNGADFDTRSTNTVNIGSVTPAPGDTTGIATSIRACVILRLPASYPVPTLASMTVVFKQLRANPGKLLLASAF